MTVYKMKPRSESSIFKIYFSLPSRNIFPAYRLSRSTSTWTTLSIAVDMIVEIRSFHNHRNKNWNPLILLHWFTGSETVPSCNLWLYNTTSRTIFHVHNHSLKMQTYLINITSLSIITWNSTCLVYQQKKNWARMEKKLSIRL